MLHTEGLEYLQHRQYLHSQITLRFGNFVFLNFLNIIFFNFNILKGVLPVGVKGYSLTTLYRSSTKLEKLCNNCLLSKYG